MTASFSAGPQALGYLHQVRYALHALLREEVEEAAVVIEGLDDIEVLGNSGPVRLDQLKHHIKGNAKLTDASSDLWKTLRIWSTQMRKKDWDPSVTRVNLVTTAEATEGSVAWHLRADEKRDVAKAHALLLDVIRTSSSHAPAMLEAFAAFQALLGREQMSLLHAITILDGAHSIVDLSSLIKQQIQLAAPPKVALRDRLYEQLEGWWFARAVEHLMRGSQEPITLMDVRRKTWTITEGLREDNLPIDYAEALPEKLDPDNDDRVFIQQLRCLDIQTERISKAILDYYRAFEQRARWARDDLLVDDELVSFERKLVDAWDQYRLALLDEPIGRVLDSEEHCQNFGRQILNWAQMNVDIRIRSNVDDRFVLRGSYHMLADAERPRVHWHPKFLARLEELLTS